MKQYNVFSEARDTSITTQGCLLTAKDLAQRLKFCRSVKITTDENVWRTYIGFYLDGVAFRHINHPHDEAKSFRTMAWRRKDEGLEPSCTAKGSHVGSAGNVAHFMVCISYDKGIILCKQYFGRINGEKFQKSLNPANRMFLQDGDPGQNSKLSKQALKSIGTTKFDIPPRSPDLNPIENVFNYVKQKLHIQALQQNITFERRMNVANVV